MSNIEALKYSSVPLPRHVCVLQPTALPQSEVASGIAFLMYDLEFKELISLEHLFSPAV